MEYKGVQIPDMVEKIDTYTLGMFSGDSDSWEVSPEEIEAMIADANSLSMGNRYNILIHKTDRSCGGSVLTFEAMVSSEEETDEVAFDRIAEQMTIIDKKK